MTPFLFYPAAGLLERHAGHRTAHAALVAEIRGLLTGIRAGPQCGAPPSSRPEPLLEPLSGSEVRVLRYLPTNLSAPEIARELSVSTNTVKTHIRHLYAKFGTHHPLRPSTWPAPSACSPPPGRARPAARPAPPLCYTARDADTQRGVVGIGPPPGLGCRSKGPLDETI